MTDSGPTPPPQAPPPLGVGGSFLIGLTAGAFGGLVGLGGGVVMVPLMVGFARLKQKEAHGTSLVALVFTGLTGAATYALKGRVDLLAAALLAITATTMARFGARYAHALPEWKLKRSFGAFLIAVALILLARPWIAGPATLASLPIRAAVLLSTGVFAGFLSGMMGVGGGSIMVPAMVLLAGFPQVLAQGSSLLAMVPAGAVGAYTHWRLGNVVRWLLPGLIAGIMVGTFVGSSLAVRLPEEALRIAFAAVIVWTGSKYVRTPRPAAAAAQPPRPA
ncbi:MAG TPA: sulfite exporter TauE/SafE family protein [Anaeromyxobacteraceae bacterium]|nr:sulfite exporter TauE/SafE family protein [Anaeromyxobacteraceae bacterium]